MTFVLGKIGLSKRKPNYTGIECSIGNLQPRGRHNSASSFIWRDKRSGRNSSWEGIPLCSVAMGFHLVAKTHKILLSSCLLMNCRQRLWSRGRGQRLRIRPKTNDVMTAECCKGRKPGCGNELLWVVRGILSEPDEGTWMTQPGECGLVPALLTTPNGGNCTW